MRGGVGLAVVLVLAVGVAGCMGEGNLIERFEDAATAIVGCVDASAVENRFARFEYAGAVTCKTATESYAWATPMPIAHVSWEGAASSGTLRVVIYDSMDRVVYDRTLDGASARGESTATQPGLPGPAVFTWTLEMEFVEFTGAMGLALSGSLGGATDKEK